MQQSATQRPQRVPATGGWRVHAPFSIQDAPPSGDGAEREWARLCAESAALGFDTLWVPAERLDGAADAGWEHCAPACARAGLRLLIDDGATAYGVPEQRGGLVRLLERLPAAPARVAVLLRGTGIRRGEGWDEVIDALRDVRSDLSITVWTPGMAPAALARLEGRGIDAVYSSLPWWDLRAAWLVDEHERLRAVAPVIAPLADPRAPRALPFDELLRGLAVASVAAEGVLVPGAPPGGASRDLFTRALVDVPAGGTLPEEGGHGPRRLTGPLSAITALFRAEGGGRLLLLNPAREHAAAVPRGVIEQRLPNGFVMPSTGTGDLELEAGAWRFAPVGLADYIVEHGMTSGQLRRSLSTALRAPRIAIEAVRPTVDGGAFPVKRGLGETVVVRADIFMDGHEELAAEVLWRAVNDTVWRRTPMAALGNDAWEARITPRRLGRYVYAIAAWLDRWGGFCVSLRKKSEAGMDVSLEVEEGRRMLAACLERATEKNAGPAEVVGAALKALGAPLDADPAPRRRRKRAMTAPPEQTESAEATPVPQATPEQVAVLLDAALADAVRRLDERAFETHTSQHYPLSIERGEAMFSSWYELFPRSQSVEAGRHGTLRDVMRRLPQIRRMGFDVLYFPPIHPIGRRNRKGRNNSLRAAPGDPGSPYAIGGPEGGHDALHPELGTLDDFRELVKAAQRHGLEIALDFAIQCSPDHPWLRENPDWFNWRADGTLKHAENPPKRYEDIVNPDFYSPLASSPRQAALWRALRDIVLFWVRQGVRIFRVDNPHTKPLPFWQWLLREVRDRHPDTLFLSEAFTRPAMMYRLAKLGFSQSYTYFTWRNTRDELAAYMTELNSPPVSDFFRPNFFVNTPDINPWFLQTSGRAGFLIRAVLAGTLSGSWGMYNGFELCEARAVPGKEEYLDSEKYQLRQWDMDAPGNIVEEISRLNRIRRSHPALQSHLGIRFHESGNDQVLFYSRHSAAGDSVVLAAVSLDPHRVQAARLELPRPEGGLAGDAPLHLHDLFEDHHFVLRGGFHTIELTPERPFVLWAPASDEGGAA